MLRVCGMNKSGLFQYLKKLTCDVSWKRITSFRTCIKNILKYLRLGSWAPGLVRHVGWWSS